eukprot:gnl/MRDRNA2_/MRDRNA2_277145_c0_seq1.p1 gnl/MRDRNA2_/MRDRNA2_277145_c0~~gnl/MRDRNA2_/MRDRNA2_277145_c0_seq1.p1  ORF type:complete len:411 (-),score=36.92 gnl/MRDRNA2_/MRDRNA2_277145_c0_seq1:173-1405(-)
MSEPLALSVMHVSPEIATDSTAGIPDIWQILIAQDLLGQKTRVYMRCIVFTPLTVIATLAMSIIAAHLAVSPEPDMVKILSGRIYVTIYYGFWSINFFVYFVVACGSIKALRCMTVKEVVELAVRMESEEPIQVMFNKNCCCWTVDFVMKPFDQPLCSCAFIWLMILRPGMYLGLLVTIQRPESFEACFFCGLQVLILSFVRIDEFMIKLFEKVSIRLIRHMRLEIQKCEAARTNDGCWFRCLQKYLHMRKQLTCLWKVALWFYIPTLCLDVNRMALCTGTVVFSVEGHNYENASFALVFLILSSCAFLVRLWSLATITDMCNSSKPLSGSIYMTAVDISGQMRMSQQDGMEYDRFLQCLVLNPSGAQLCKIVDRGLVLKLAVPAGTAFMSCVSYLVHSLSEWQNGFVDV